MCARRCGPRCARSPPLPKGALFPAELVSGLSAAPASASAARDAGTLAGVVQQYAMLLHLSLGRVSQNRFDLAGLQVAADLEALASSLGRCVECAVHPLLLEWHTTLQLIM